MSTCMGHDSAYNEYCTLEMGHDDAHRFYRHYSYRYTDGNGIGGEAVMRLLNEPPSTMEAEAWGHPVTLQLAGFAPLPDSTYVDG